MGPKMPNDMLQAAEESNLKGGRNDEWEDVQENEIRTCNACSKLETDLPHPLKFCAKCHLAQYCSRKCQKSDRKFHKPTCAANNNTQSANNKPSPHDSSSLLSSSTAPKASTGGKPTPPQEQSLEDMLRTLSLGSGIPPPTVHSTIHPSSSLLSSLGSEKNFLESLPPRKAFAFIIDAYRMCVEDDYTFNGDASGLYAGEDPLPGFRKFLNKAEKQRGRGGDVLPSWWSKEHRRNCERQAVRESEFSCIHYAVEKSDIQEHYEDPTMPMVLRMWAERVYGRSVMRF